MTRAPSRLVIAAVTSGALLAVGTLATTAFADTTPNAAKTTQETHTAAQDAQKAILAAFDRYEVVAGAAPNDAYLDLIRNPAGGVDEVEVGEGERVGRVAVPPDEFGQRVEGALGQLVDAGGSVRGIIRRVPARCWAVVRRPESGSPSWASA